MILNTLQGFDVYYMNLIPILLKQPIKLLKSSGFCPLDPRAVFGDEILFGSNVPKSITSNICVCS